MHHSAKQCLQFGCHLPSLLAATLLDRADFDSLPSVFPRIFADPRWRAHFLSLSFDLLFLAARVHQRPKYRIAESPSFSCRAAQQTRAQWEGVGSTGTLGRLVCVSVCACMCRVCVCVRVCVCAACALCGPRVFRRACMSVWGGRYVYACVSACMGVWCVITY